MQRVSAFLPTWDKRTSGSSSRTGIFSWGSNRSSTGNTAVPSSSALAKINTTAANANARFSLGSSQMQREAFWPAGLDVECEKAARILKSFSTDGYLAPLNEEDDQVEDADSQTPVHITKKIPRRIIQNAAGIAIFTCMRSGLWMTGSGGSGILIARKSDGTWSPPSSIMLHTPTLSFIMGVDIYDCVLIINNLAALESITKPRVTLGEDVGLTSGPLVSLDSDEAHIRWKDLGNTVLTYLKARGQNQTVNLNGCILAERANENERFYAAGVTQMDILAGNVTRNVEETKPLFEVIKMAEGRSDYDAAVVDGIVFALAPGDATIATPMSSTPASPRKGFGIPSADDPDPFGVLALEMAGLEIREAGTRLRPSSNQFDFNPAPTSPAFSKFSRKSLENFPKSNRASIMSSRTVKSLMTDAGTQTDVGNTPETTPSPSRSEGSYGRASPTQIPEVAEEEEAVDYTKVDLTPLKHLSTPPTSVKQTSQGTSTTMQQEISKAEEPVLKYHSDTASSHYDEEHDNESDNEVKDLDDRDADDEDEMDDSDEVSDDDSDDQSEDDEEPVVFEVAAVQPARTQAVASRVIHAKGSVVTIPKRLPPPLPMRSPARTSRSSKSELGDVSHLRSPLRQEFPESDVHADDGQQTRAESSPYLKPTDLKLVLVGPERRDSVKSKAETESLRSRESKAFDAELMEAKTEDTDVETATTPKTTESKGLELSTSNQQLSHSDSSESLAKKRTSSIYTGNTENRWSMDGSSLTTPTSERPYSVIDDAVDDDTPQKSTKDSEKIELNEKYGDLEKMGSNETTPNTITVV
ncbi:hypothetical protein BGZ63DRAFT_188826 [Mariannaea sp. PMI_226]|nr:hypothetical protein BGZ63DRAFT_188826 [Mariannaea sp. PMI_226]